MCTLSFIQFQIKINGSYVRGPCYRRIFVKNQDAAGGKDTSLEKAEKVGYLHTFSSKTFLSREKWKKRYYVLTGTKLYRFLKKEDASLELSAASRRRLINLDSYDICQQISESECKKEHAFILDGANSSTDQIKYVFAAENKAEMQDWISRLRKAILGVRGGGGRALPRPPRSKVMSLQMTTTTQDANDKFISNSLCELDGSLSDEDIVRPVGIRRSSANSPPMGDRARCNSASHLAYEYSSSDDSLLKERSKTPSQMVEEDDDNGKEDEIKALLKPKPQNDKSPGILKHDPKPSADVEAGASTDKEEPKTPGVGPLIYMSAKLLEMSGALARFQRNAKEELDAIKEHLADVKKKLFEYPPGTTQVDIIASKACIIMTDLNSTEEDLETLLNVTSRMQKSLQQVKEKCDEMINDI